MGCQACLALPAPRRYPATEEGRAAMSRKLSEWRLVYQAPVYLSYDMDTNEHVISLWFRETGEVG